MSRLLRAQVRYLEAIFPHAVQCSCDALVFVCESVNMVTVKFHMFLFRKTSESWFLNLSSDTDCRDTVDNLGFSFQHKGRTSFGEMHDK